MTTSPFPAEAATARRMARRVEEDLGLRQDEAIPQQDTGYDEEVVEAVRLYQEYIKAIPITTDSNSERERELWMHFRLDPRLR